MIYPRARCHYRGRVPELPEVEVVRSGLERWVVGRTVAKAEMLHPRATRRHVAGPDDVVARLTGRTLTGVERRGKYLGLSVEPLTGPPGDQVPAVIAHIARDPLDPAFDLAAFTAAVRRRRTGIKRALLHWARATDRLTRPAIATLVEAVRAVMNEALAAGGTSFDSLYVNVNGESGYFERSLHVYGREHEPCPRCGTPIRRDPFMNRSSFSCPRCQPRPRNGRW